MKPRLCSPPVLVALRAALACRRGAVGVALCATSLARGRSALGVALCAAALALAACGSAPPTRFHTLLAAAPTGDAAPPAHIAWELLPVAVPAQVDQPQFVLRGADGTLALLEHDRWIAPLADELRAALLDGLSRRLGPPLAHAGSGKLWRVRVDVQRFDSGPGAQVREDVDWAVLGDAGAALQCRAVFAASAEGGVAALAAGHRQAVARLADAIAAAVAALAAGQPASCPPRS